jgi:hypothetical protein
MFHHIPSLVAATAAAKRPNAPESIALRIFSRACQPLAGRAITRLAQNLHQAETALDFARGRRPRSTMCWAACELVDGVLRRVADCTQNKINGHASQESVQHQDGAGLSRIV